MVCERAHGQWDHQIRFEWGATGATSLRADVSVVIDVLSFSTSVTIAVERGMQVYPYRWRDESAADFAAQHEAHLAVGRVEALGLAGPPPPCLSPSALLTCEPVERLVLPSPNGSTITQHLGALGGRVLIGCLRNADAVAAHLEELVREGRSVALVAAGERWTTDDSLRPAWEDQIGAGAIAAAMGLRGALRRAGPEVLATAEMFAATAPMLRERMAGCASGRELIALGWDADVNAAAALNSSSTVPHLRGGVLTS